MSMMVWRKSIIIIAFGIRRELLESERGETPKADPENAKPNWG